MVVADVIKIAKVSQYLATADIAKQPVWARRIDVRLGIMLYAERKALEYIYNNSPSDASIVGVANYVYALCGEYGIKAQAILSMALVSGSVYLGGGVSTPITLVPADIDGIVGGTPNMPTVGDSTWQNASFAGYGVRLRINGHDISPLPGTVDGYYFQKTKTSDTLTLIGNGGVLPVFNTNDEIHVEFYLIQQDVSTYTILSEDGRNLGGEDDTTVIGTG